MPELPEVQSSVFFLNEKVLNRTFVGVWTDTPKMGKVKGSLKKEFKDLIKKKKILKIKRRAKNIIFYLSENYSLLVHYKMTGHLLVGKWENSKGFWKSKIKGPLSDDKMNQYIRFIFFFQDGEQLAFSDLRKFGKIELWRTPELEKELSVLGVEPFSSKFTFNYFYQLIKGKKQKIKPLLLDQSIISGIGNIYASDSLWMAKINPEKTAKELSEEEIRRLHKSILEVLEEAISKKGDSMVDFRLPNGEKGEYQNYQKVYDKKGESCIRCNTKIEKIKISGRGTFYCPKCQKI